MKRYLLGVFVLCVGVLAVPQGKVLAAGPAFVQATSTCGTYCHGGTTTTLSLKFPGNVVTGDAIVIAITNSTAANIVSGCRDTNNATSSYKEAGGVYDTGEAYGVEIWYATNVQGGTTPTVTCSFSRAASYAAMSIHEYSGIAATNALDATSTVDNDNGGTSLTTGTSTTHAAGELIFGAFANTSALWTSFTAGSGFTTRTNMAMTAGLGTEDKVQSSAGAVSATATAAPSDNTTNIMAMFEASTASSTPGITSFTASPAIIAPGATSTLSWSVTNASSVTIMAAGMNIGTSTLSGVVAVNPTSTTVYTLSAVNANGSTTATTTVTVDGTAPTAPGNLTATPAGFTQINLAWSSSTDAGGSGIGGYNIYRCTGSACTPNVLIGTTAATSYSDTGVATGTTYVYDATAYNGVGILSALSNTATATTGSGGTTSTPPTSNGSIPADIYENMQAGTDGQLLTTALAQAASYGIGGTWSAATSTTQSSLYVSAAAANSLPVPVSVNGGATYSNPSTLGWSFNHSGTGSGFAMFTPSSTLSYFSVGSFVSFAVPQGWYNNYDYLGIRNYPSGIDINYSTQANSSNVVRTEGRVNGVTQWGPDIAVTPGKVYWIDVVFNATSSNSYTSLYVYDPATWTLVGSSTAPMDDVPATELDFGVQNDGANTGPWASYWDNILINWSNPQFPLVPENVPPTVTLFSMPQTSSSTTVAVTSLAATDNVDVAGYLITQSSTAPNPTATGWTISAPLSYTFSGTGIETAYAWAKDAIGNVSAAASQTVTVGYVPPDTTPPSVPTGLTVTGVTPSTVSLSWSPSTDNVGVAGYQIFRNGTDVATTTVTSFTDTGLAASTTYSYDVDAFDAAGNVSATSTPVATTTAPLPPPPTIASFAVNPSSITAGQSSTLSWSTSGATSLSIDNGVGMVTGTAETISPATTTTYTLTAANGYGSSTASTTVIVSPDTIPPSISIGNPANNTVVSGTVAVSGTASDNISVANVQVSIDGGAYVPATGTSSWSYSWNTIPLQNGSHTVTVQALDPSGNPATTTVTVTVSNIDTMAPSIPAGLKAGAVTTSTINFSWNASTDNVGVAGYDVYRGGVLIATTTATSFIDTGLASSTTYSYTVAAFDAAGNVSTQSQALAVTTASGNSSTPSFVQGAIGNDWSPTSLPVVFSKNVTTGDVIAFGVHWGSSTVKLNSVTATCATASGTLLDNPTLYATTASAAQGYLVTTASGACTVTATFSKAVGGSASLLIEELKGVNTANPLDAAAMKHLDAPGTGANAATSGNVTTTQSGDYLVGIGVDDASDGIVWTAGTGYTTTVPAANLLVAEDMVQATSGPTAAIFTITPGWAHVTVGVMAFKAAAGGGTGQVVKK